MKRITTLFSVWGGSLILVPMAMAAEERRPPGNLAVWGFLAFCALIIVAQLIPLVRHIGRQKVAVDKVRDESIVVHAQEEAGKPD